MIGQPYCVDNQDKLRPIYVRSICTIPNWNDISSHVYCSYKLELTYSLDMSASQKIYFDETFRSSSFFNDADQMASFKKTKKCQI